MNADAQTVASTSFVNRQNVKLTFGSNTIISTPVIPPQTPVPSNTPTLTANVSAPTSIPILSEAEASVTAAKISAVVALIVAILSALITGISLILQSRIAKQQLKVQINQLEARYQEIKIDIEQKRSEVDESRRQFEQKLLLDQKKLALEHPSSLHENAIRLLYQFQPTNVEAPEITGTPYVVGPPVIPTNFIGRKEIVSQIFTRLQSAQMMSTSVIGLQRSGKTSLLHYIRDEVVIQSQMRENSNSFLLCYLNMQNDINNPAEFYRQMIQSSIRTLAAKKQIQNYSLSGEVNRLGLENFLDAMMSLGLNLVFLVDEFDRVGGGNFDRDFLEGLRALSSDRRLAWILVSHNSLDVIGQRMEIPAGSPFYNIITPPPLFVGSLITEDAQQLIRHPTRNVNVDVEDEEISFLIDLAGYLPFSLQMAAAFLWNAKTTKPLTESRRQEVANLFMEVMKPYYYHHWKHQLSSNEQRLLIQLTNKNIQLTNDDRNHLIATAQRLKFLGIIAESEHDYKITSKAFCNWVEEHGSSF